MKRKKAQGRVESGEDDERSKRAKTSVPAASEIIDKVWKDVYGDKTLSDVAQASLES
jgi:hypothetical protein